ncbi:hypothetical protein [Methylobacterium sp. 13MFTsu3.1M2]|uniref:hypothetical protein n=1 Tax=Methylobacterium sp. 13MFTsu3.1M2 TaxID=1502776 RepID=UPI00147A1E46|nr:hypothetical protein [Methylobacterium sp. 13MFTsu3.1M2]
MLREAEELYESRKYIKVSNREQIGIDKPVAPGQQTHGHLENGRAVNKDGSLSHGGSPFYLTKAQEKALLAANFKIPKSRLIESEGDMVTVTISHELYELLEELKRHVA